MYLFGSCGDSAVKSTTFDSQHSHGTSQLSVAPVPGFQHPLLAFAGTRHVYGAETYM